MSENGLGSSEHPNGRNRPHPRTLKAPRTPAKIESGSRQISTMEMKTLRCAIYTRKSSEDGLEQDFNSLHAQREACEAYISSQKHEGWIVLPSTKHL